jgi:hypothetical protein
MTLMSKDANVLVEDAIEDAMQEGHAWILTRDKSA